MSAALALAGCGTAPQTAAATSSGLHGREPDQVVERPSFVLTDTSGRAYDFAEETAGRPTLLYFGYTDCPDECPTAMADITAALRTVDAELRERTAVVFVTTDPSRDDGPRLRQWLDRYSTTYVGLTGTQEQVQRAQEAAGATVAVRGEPVPTLPGSPTEHEHAPGTAPHTHDRPLGDLVEHATSIFAYDASDRLPVLYPESVSPSDIRADLPVLARKEPST